MLVWGTNYIGEPDLMWLLEGKEITDFTLRHQRMYAKEPDGTWTRPKDGGSWNSLEGDW